MDQNNQKLPDQGQVNQNNDQYFNDTPIKHPPFETQSSVVSEPSHKKFMLGGKKLLAVIVIAVLVMFGGAFAFYQAQVNKPENIVKQAFADSYEQNSAKFDISIQDPESDAKFSVNGSYDQANLAVEATAAYMDSDSSIEGELNLRYLDQSLYFQIGNLSEETAAGLGFFAGILQQIEGQWIALESSDLEQYGSLIEAETPDQQDLQLSDGEIDEISDIIKETDFFIASELAGLDVDGQVAKGYKIEFQKEGLIELIEKLKNSQVKLLNENSDQLDEAIAELKQADQSEIDRTSIQVYISDGLVSTIIIEDTQEQSDIGTLSLKLFDYGQTVEITAPSDAISVDQVFANLFGESLETLEP